MPFCMLKTYLDAFGHALAFSVVLRETILQTKEKGLIFLFSFKVWVR